MITEHFPTLNWHKSSYSNSNGQCVEVASTGSGIAVRDSKNPGGPVLAFGAGEWRAFVAGITAGRLDPS
jgi:hypothetical protein